MKKKILSKNKKGTLLIGVLIVFLMISAVCLAVIFRTSAGQKVVTGSKQGYSAYQASDQNAEKIMNDIRKLDDDTANKIPENTKASDYCSGSDICLDGDGNDAISGYTSDIMSVQQTGNFENTQRKIYAPLPGRVPNTVKSFKLQQCGSSPLASGCTQNRCDVRLNWDGSGVDPSVSKAYEMRRSTRSNLQSDPSGYGWRLFPVAEGTNPTGSLSTGSDISVLVKNNDDPNVDTQYNKDYSYSLKIQNSQNFDMDSLYYPYLATVSIGSKDCTHLDGNPNVLTGYSCQSVQKDGMITSKTSYNCCDGTECWQADTGTAENWVPSPDRMCAIEKCLSGDEPSYCGTTVSCAPSTGCGFIYKRSGYCSSCSAGWSSGTLWNIRKWEGGNDSEPSCCKHNCSDWNPGPCTAPAGCTATDTRSCSENSCGDYSLSGSCDIYCPPPPPPKKK